MSNKIDGGYDLLSNLEDNDVFGSKAISSIQSYDSGVLFDRLSSGEGRPDLIVGLNSNDYGYLLFSNPAGTWSINEIYSYYPSEAILLSRISFPEM